MVEICGNKVRLGVIAPKDCSVMRAELHRPMARLTRLELPSLKSDGEPLVMFFRFRLNFRNKTWDWSEAIQGTGLTPEDCLTDATVEIARRTRGMNIDDVQAVILQSADLLEAVAL